jgi:hypothetical protein
MGKSKIEGERDDWEVELTKVLAKRLPGIYAELFKPGKSSVVLSPSLSVRLWRGSFLAVLRGDRVDRGGRVVCFGAGDNPIQALRNLSASVQRGDWRRDKFANDTQSVAERLFQPRPQSLGSESLERPQNCGGALPGQIRLPGVD